MVREEDQVFSSNSSHDISKLSTVSDNLLNSFNYILAIILFWFSVADETKKN